MGTLWRGALAAAIAFAVSVPGGAADEWARDLTGDLFVPPAPMTAKRLFNPIAEAEDPACPRMDEVVLHYVRSGSGLKSGNVKLLVGDLPQLFSDAWRRRLKMPTVGITSVVAQPLDLTRL